MNMNSIETNFSYLDTKNRLKKRVFSTKDMLVVTRATLETTKAMVSASQKQVTTTTIQFEPTDS